MSRLLAFLMCERATFNRSEKVTLHGLFDGLRVPRSGEPSVGDPRRVFVVFYKMETEAPCTVSLRIVKPSGEQIAGEWADSVTFWSAAPLTWQSIWTVTTDLFQEPGSYTLELLWSNGSPAVPIGQTRLFVERT